MIGREMLDSDVKRMWLPVLYIPATRVSLRGRNIFDQTIYDAANLESETFMTR